MEKIMEKFRGCLIGGASGDALGYAVEFSPDNQIFSEYGPNGITKYELVNGVALISDDTQMTLFTANGLILGALNNENNYLKYIDGCYSDWLATQLSEEGCVSHSQFSCLNRIPQLNSRRAPGNTCIFTIGKGANINNPINTSKGCGGIMRVAPIGLYFASDEKMPAKADIIGAESAALTHGHELGYIPAAFLVHIIRLLLVNPDIDLLSAVKDAKQAIVKLFSDAKHLNELMTLVDKAVELSDKDIDDIDGIRELGEGWVAEETLAIAIYCCLKYPNSFEKAIIAAVNHSGDSDSTGAVTGNIMGAYLGMGGIPHKFIDNLELGKQISEIADDLFYAAYNLDAYYEILKNKYIV